MKSKTFSIFLHSFKTAIDQPTNEHYRMKKLDKTTKKLGQFIDDNHLLDADDEIFFKKSALRIGLIVHGFNSLDALLNSTICQLINEEDDKLGAVIICKQTFTNKVDLFDRLIDLYENECGGTVPTRKQLIEDLKECAKLRNAVVHAEWDSTDDVGNTYTRMYTTQKGLHQEYYQFTPEALEKIDMFVHDTYILFDKFDMDRRVLLEQEI